MDAPPIRFPTRDPRATLVAGLLGGVLGTSVMIVLGVVSEWASGVPPRQLGMILELGFGGPLSTLGSFGPATVLPLHYVHGALLGLLLGVLIMATSRTRFADRLPDWVTGLAFGAVISPVVLALLVASVTLVLTPGLVGLVFLLHLGFGATVGGVVQGLRGPCIGRGPR